MRVQHNIMAMGAYRNYTNNVNAMKKNLEKLSSGYKINRAGDDAAGLAISEKMRAQITGLQQAQNNAKSGINLVQTAEGALQEVHDMLNRMVKLADQSANGTYDDTTDREQLQKEVNQLREEINRIADSANFNGINLLDGSLSAGGAGAKDISVKAVADGLRGTGAVAQKGSYSIDFSDLKINVAAGVISATDALVTLTLDGKTLGTIQLKTARTATDPAAELTVSAFSFVVDDAFTTANVTIGGLEFSITGGASVTLAGKGKGGTADPTTADAETFNGTSLAVSATFGASVTSHNNGYDFAVHATQKVQAADFNKLAQGEFSLNDGQITDGATLKIGDTTYTFKVGTTDDDTGSGTTVNLKGWEAGQAGIAAEAARLLSQRTDNTQFHIQTIGKDGTIRLTEKDGVFTKYDKWDLQGTKGSETDATWLDSSGKSAVQFSGGGSSGGLTLQIGDTSDSFNQLKVSIKDMHCASLGIASIDISDQTKAASAINAIKTAINTVSDVRGTLGATQNRLEHTINNLSVMTENIQDAESTIRDTDVAEEMMAYTKNNILIQSAQAMLAQANQVPQGVLQLLQ